MLNLVEECRSSWQQKIIEDFPQSHPQWREGVLGWLFTVVAETPEKGWINNFKEIEPEIACRYSIFKNRYGMRSSVEGYRNLLNRLGALLGRYHNLRNRLQANAGERNIVTKLIESLISQLLLKDPYLRQEQQKIANYTQDPDLSHALIFASIEAYLMQCPGSQPRFIERLIDLLRLEL